MEPLFHSKLSNKKVFFLYTVHSAEIYGLCRDREDCAFLTKNCWHILSVAAGFHLIIAFIFESCCQGPPIFLTSLLIITHIVSMCSHTQKNIFVGRSKVVREVTRSMALRALTLSSLLRFFITKALLRWGAWLARLILCRNKHTYSVNVLTHAKGDVGEVTAVKGSELKPALFVFIHIFCFRSPPESIGECVCVGVFARLLCCPFMHMCTRLSLFVLITVRRVHLCQMCSWSSAHR